MSLAHDSWQAVAFLTPGNALTRAQRQREEEGGGGGGRARETGPSRAETQGVAGVLSLREQQEPGPQLYPCWLRWAAPPSRRGRGSVQAGVRAFTMVHLARAPGLPIQP